MAKKEIVDAGENAQQSAPQRAPTSIIGMRAKAVHLGLGLDLLGSKMALNTRNDKSTLEVLEFGILATGKSGRMVFIPWANIKGCELDNGDVSQAAGVPGEVKTLPAKPGKVVAKE